MKGSFSAAQTRAIFRAIRRTNFSDSMTHGPRRKAGVLPPSMTGPIVRGFVFTANPVSRINFLKSKPKLGDGAEDRPPLSQIAIAIRHP